MPQTYHFIGKNLPREIYEMLFSLVETQAVDYTSGHTIMSMNRNVRRLVSSVITMLFHVLFGKR